MRPASFAPRAPVSIAVLAAIGAAAFGVMVACGVDGKLMQGGEYLPDGALELGTPTERSDASIACNGSDCDGGAVDVVSVVPLTDGSTEPINTCGAPHDLGTVSGDTGSGSLTAKGTCSEWFGFRVTEDDSSALGATMKLKLTLTPSGADFELYAYLDKSTDRLVCEAPTAESFRPGTAVEDVAYTWGEGSVANGKDDGRTVRVAVIRASGTCAGDAGSYTLLAEGNR